MKDVESERPTALRIAAMLPARRRARPPHRRGIDRRAEAGRRGRHLVAAPRGAIAAAAARPRDRADPRQCRNAAEEGRGGRSRCDLARRGRARPARTSTPAPPIPAEIILPAPGQAAIGIECRTNDTANPGVLTHVSNADTFDCVMAERAFTRALGATCASPVAAFCVLEDGDLRHARAIVQRGRQRDGRGTRRIRLRRFRIRRKARPSMLAAAPDPCAGCSRPA